jgi:hypothetical protein
MKDMGRMCSTHAGEVDIKFIKGKPDRKTERLGMNMRIILHETYRTRMRGCGLDWCGSG